MAIYIIMVLISSMGGGCARYDYFSDINHDQPWVSPKEKAIAVPFRKWAFLGYTDHLKWEKPNSLFVKYDATKIVYKSVNYLSDKELWKKPLNQTFHYEDLKTESILNPGSLQLGWVFPKTYALVCLKPPIVLEINHNILSYSPMDGTRNMPLVNILAPLFDNKISECHIRLYYGFIYGSRVPYSPEPDWFSPDLNIGPIVTEKITDTQRRIPVPWGSLILTREGDEWVVTTEEN